MDNNTKNPDYFEEYPLGIRSELMLKNQLDVRFNFSEDIWEEYNAEYRRIENLIVDRNIRGQKLEKNGQIEEAIDLYEKNAEIFTTTSHPYHRLRIIYTRQKKFHKAIEACEKAIKAYKIYGQVTDHDLSDVIAEFEAWIEKLEKKL